VILQKQKHGRFSTTAAGVTCSYREVKFGAVDTQLITELHSLQRILLHFIDMVNRNNKFKYWSEKSPLF